MKIKRKIEKKRDKKVQIEKGNKSAFKNWKSKLAEEKSHS